MGKYTETFTSGDLSSGVLTVTHSLGQEISDCIVVDSSSNVICPDVSYTDEDELTVDLSETGITSGTVVVMSDEGCLAADKTVNLDNSMSASEIQAEIDAQPKNLNGHTLTFQFADGTYNLSNYLNFEFFNNGYLEIYGDTSETDATDLHTTQSVILDGSSITSSATCGALNIKNVSAETKIFNLKIIVPDSANVNGIYSYKSNFVRSYYNYLLGSGKTNDLSGIYYTNASAGIAYKNYVSNIMRGLRCNLSSFVSNTNDDTGTLPDYGLSCYLAGTIGKLSTQPNGATSDEIIGSGGEIR